MSNNCQFTLDGVIPNSSVAVAVADFQRNIDFIFLKQIMICLSQESLTESERDSLIDFKYGLIATSSKLEDHFLSQELNLPKTNSELSNFELNISSNYAVKKVMELTEYLTLLIDDNIDEQTLPIALYLKSCIPVLPPLFVGGTLHELQNCISLLQQFEGCSGESRKKVCKLLSYIIGDTCQLENIEEESKQKLIELPEIMK